MSFSVFDSLKKKINGEDSDRNNSNETTNIRNSFEDSSNSSLMDGTIDETLNNDEPQKKGYSFPVYNAIKNKVKDMKEKEALRNQSRVETEEEDEETKKETAISILLEAARHRMMTRKLVGTVKISQMVGMHTSGVENFIDESEYDSVLEHECDISDLEKEHSLVGQAKDALNSIENIIQSLLNRSKSWEGCPYKNTTSISRDVSVGFYLPVFMIIGFSITIEISCTISSLIASRKQEKTIKLLDMQLRQIDNSVELVKAIVGEGYTVVEAKMAVVATNGTSLENALQYLRTTLSI